MAENLTRKWRKRYEREINASPSAIGVDFVTSATRPSAEKAPVTLNCVAEPVVGGGNNTGTLYPDGSQATSWA